jgi:hypothetical protein
MSQFYNENQETHKSICRFRRLLFPLVNGIYEFNMSQYIWRVKARLPDRYMTPCRVLARGRMNSCLVEFEDGYRVVTSRNYLMKFETLQKRRAKESLKKRDPKGL